MTYLIDAEHIFTLFFIMLGPVKLLMPFALATRNMSVEELRHLSVRAAVLGTIILLVGTYAGYVLLNKWGISVPVLLLAGGMILLIISLRMVTGSAHAQPGTEATPSAPTALQVIFPMLITPYGIAVAIVLLAASMDGERTVMILGLMVANMLLNLLCMVFVRPILKAITPTGMQIIFSVLGVLMVALALQMVLSSFVMLDIIQG